VQGVKKMCHLHRTYYGDGHTLDADNFWCDIKLTSRII